MKLFQRFAILLAVLLLATTAFGQTTGRLGGTASNNGEALPGVTVTISSSALQGTRTAYTDVNGNYQFGALAPGNYTVVFAMESMQNVTRTVNVTVAGNARADANMRLTTLAEAITVTASAPAVVETSEVQTTLEEDLIEELPVGRTLLATVNMAPGVTSTGAGGNTVISGAQAFDSAYYVDGAVVNEVLRGQPLDLFIEDALLETTVQTGAVSAEYGRFTGGVVTAVTKGGGNEFSGSIRDSFTNPSWTSTTNFGEDKADSILNEVYEATFGGRIVRDRLWFFTAGRFFETSTPNFFENSTESFNFNREQTRLEAKLTGQITPKHTLVGNLLQLEDTQDNYSFGSIWESSSIDPTRDVPQEKMVFNYNGIITNNFLVEVLYSESELRFVGSGGAQGDFAHASNVYDYFGNAYLGAPTFAESMGDVVRSNDDLLVKGTYFLSTSAIGTHNIVFGYDDFTNHQLENNPQSGSDFTIWTFTDPVRNSSGVVMPTFSSGDFIIWFPVLEAAKTSDFNTQSLFINDKWELSPKFSFNLGVRYDDNYAKNQNGRVVADDTVISPRLGATYDVFADGRLRVTGSYSTYASKIAGGNVGESASSAGSPSYLYWSYEGPTISGLSTVNALQQMYNWFSSVGGVKNRDFLIGGGTAGIQTQIPEPLTSPNMNEWTIGASTQIGNAGFLRLDYQTREWHDFYTNVQTTATGQAYDPLGDYDVDIIEVRNSDDFERTYDAVLVQGGYRLFNRLNLGANYTWSESKGNIVGETGGSGPTVSAGWNYQPELIGYDRRLPVGFLPNDQTHKVRAWLQYDQPTPFGNFNFSLLQRFDSGTPYSIAGGIDVTKRTACPQCPVNPGYMAPSTNNTYFFSERGEYRFKDLTATDLAINYDLPIMGRFNVFVQGEVLNLLDEDTLLGHDTTVLTARNSSCKQTANPTARCLAFNPFTETPVEGVHWRKGARFGQATGVGSYQNPITYRFSAGLRF